MSCFCIDSASLPKPGNTTISVRSMPGLVAGTRMLAIGFFALPIVKQAESGAQNAKTQSRRRLFFIITSPCCFRATDDVRKDRNSVVMGQSVQVLENLGGRGILKKKK